MGKDGELRGTAIMSVGMERLDLFSIGVSEKRNHDDPQETSMLITGNLFVDYGVSTVWQSRPAHSHDSVYSCSSMNGSLGACSHESGR